MNESAEYNPLDYANLTRNCVNELMTRGPFSMPPPGPFSGAGVYALFYDGDFSPYQSLCSPDATHPIYVGKAVPPGGRKGGMGLPGEPVSGHPLYNRLTQHVGSIQAAANLQLLDFRCRYLVVTPLWITMAERFLIEHYRPIWITCIDGFGNHDPGVGRHQGEISWWDVLHPGRPWAARLRQTRTQTDALARLERCLTHPPALNLEESNDESDE